MAEQILNYFTSPEVMAEAARISTQKNALIQSGAVVADSLLGQKVSGGADTAVLAWNDDLDYTVEPDAMNTDPDSEATPSELSGSDANVRVAYMHHAWQIANMVDILAVQSDPAMHLAVKLANYRQTWEQKYLLAMLKGIVADNIANDSGDMVNDIYDDIATPLAANKPDLEQIILTSLTAGDRRGEFGIMAAHSITVAKLEILDAEGFTMEKDSAGLIPDIKKYRGMTVIEDDAMTIDVGTNSNKYYTYFLGQGAFGYAPAPLPSRSPETEISREALKGNGGGVDVHHYRWATARNPYGIDCTIASGTAPVLSNLSLAASWDRKVDRKLVPIACLTHNN